MNDPTRQVNPEFFVKVNDFLEMANRIERRLDASHAQVVMLHAFSRYGAHHYKSTVKVDGADERLAYASYLGNSVAHMVLENIDQLSGPAPSAEADEPAAE